MKFTEEQILEIARVFDDIITSDSVAVHSSFQRLALLSSLAATPKDEPGPFEQLVRQLDWMESEYKELARKVQILENGDVVDLRGKPDYKISPGTAINLGGISGLTGTMTMAGPDIDLSGIQTITLNPPHVAPLTPENIITIYNNSSDTNA